MSKRPADVDAGWDELPDPDPERFPTPWPSFDLAAYARDSETSLMASEANKTPTAPPPPYHPASIRSRQSHVRELGESLAPVLRRRIAETTERVQLVRTQLRIGGLSQEEAARALTSELAALEGDAARTGSSLAPLTVALRTAIEELAGIAGLQPSVQFDVIVLDERPDARARVVLAVESLGHVARSATGLTELALLSERRIPDAIFVAAAEGGAVQPEICTMLREVVRSEHVAIVMYGDPRLSLADRARDAGTRWWFRVDEEIEVMMEEVGRVFGGLLL